MMPLADLFVHVFVLVDDALRAGRVPIPHRPGPTPVCADAEILTIALVRHLLRRPSARAFLAAVRPDWAHYFPRLPAQSEFNRRVRWLWGAFASLRRHVVSQRPEDAWQQVDTTALPVKHPRRVRGPDDGHGPGELHAGFGRDAAHGEWFSGFRLALRTGETVRWTVSRARGWSGPGASFPRRWTSERWPTLCWQAPPPAACCWTAASLARRGGRCRKRGGETLRWSVSRSS